MSEFKMSLLFNFYQKVTKLDKIQLMAHIRVVSWAKLF